jgi:excisionase family DNA binding protein
MPKTTGERWMRVPEAAEYLGIGMRTLYKFLDEGRIPAYKLGQVIRMKRADVLTLVIGQSVPIVRGRY